MRQLAWTWCLPTLDGEREGWQNSIMQHPSFVPSSDPNRLQLNCHRGNLEEQVSSSGAMNH